MKKSQVKTIKSFTDSMKMEIANELGIDIKNIKPNKSTKTNNKPTNKSNKSNKSNKTN